MNQQSFPAARMRLAFYRFRFALLATVAVVCINTALGAVVRPAPNVQWLDAAGRPRSMTVFRGQPVIVIIAPSPRDRKFRSQLGQLKRMYERLAAQKTVFIAAFTAEEGRVGSNIPFVLAADGPRVAHDYEGSGNFAIAVIGRDGNLDYVTTKVVPVQRIFDVINNSFVPQEKLRRP